MNKADHCYVLVTPVRDEENTIRKTIQSVVGQSILPREWVIVSDGSTDDTDKIINLESRKNPWIRLLQLDPRDGRDFGAVVNNTVTGIKHLKFSEYDYLGLVDADVEFQSDYFERLIEKFQNQPALGLAGGVVIDVGLPRDRFPRNRKDIPGAMQFFRRECFERIGGLLPIPEGGWDMITCAMARMHGYETKLFTDLVVDHLKPRNIAHGGAIRRKWQMGIRDHALGYHPLFEALKCAGRLTEPPLGIGALAWLAGYGFATIRRRRRAVGSDVVRYVRQEQMVRMKRLARIPVAATDQEPTCSWNPL